MDRKTADYATLFTATWNQFKTRGLVILAVLLIFVVFLVLAGFVLGLAGIFVGKPMLAELQSGQPASLVMAGGALFLFVTLFFLLCMWSQASVLAVSVDRSLGIKDGLRAGWKYLWPLTWVSLLVFGVVLIGLSLLVIPGIIFIVWFSFAMYIMVDEDKRGIDSLLASKHYVDGYWWDTFCKFFVVWMMSGLVGVVPFVGQILSLLFTPFLVLFLVNVYRDLKELKGGTVDSKDLKNRSWWGVVAGIGLVAPAVVLGVMLLTLGPNLSKLISQGSSELPQFSQAEMPSSPLPSPSQPDIVTEPSVEPSTPVESEMDSPGSVSWNDPVGDVGRDGASRWLDVRSVTITGQENVLIMKVTLNNQLAAFYNAGSEDRSLGRLISFFIDSDVSRETGGAVLADSGRSGYDIGIDVILEARAEDPDSRVAHVPVSKIEGKRIRSLGRLDMEQVELTGKELILHFPYEMGGLMRGDQIRICFRELSQGLGEGLSKDKLLILP